MAGLALGLAEMTMKRFHETSLLDSKEAQERKASFIAMRSKTKANKAR